MDKKIIIIAAVLLGGAACVYAVTEMDSESEELSATDPGDVTDPPTVPPMQVDAGTPNVQAPPEPEGALDPIIQEQLSAGILSRSVSCGGNSCDPGELCCVGTGECVSATCTDCCEGPEQQVPTPPNEAGINPPPEPQ